MDPRNQSSSWLTVQAGDTVYALPLAGVVEVVRAVALAKVPGGSGPLVGICLYRGQPVPCVHLRAIAGAGSSEIRLEDRLVILRAGGSLLGLLVDDALEVLAIAATGGAGPGTLAPYVDDVLSVDHRLLLVLNPQRLADQLRVSMTIL